MCFICGQIIECEERNIILKKKNLIMTFDFTSTQPSRAVVEISFNLTMDREKIFGLSPFFPPLNFE